jgi:hypothetical protein
MGNVLITGFFRSDSVLIGTTELINKNLGFAQLFVAKFNSAGTFQWAVTAGGGSRSSDDIPYAIATDNKGDAYICGYFYSSSLAIGSTVLSDSGQVDIFIAKYDSNGFPLWAGRAGGSLPDQALGIATDGKSKVFITGNFQSASITFGSITLANAAPGNSDIYVAAYDSSGTALWAKSTGGSDSEGANAIATDGIGNIYITGAFASNNLTFGTTVLHNGGQNDVFIAKYDPAGHCIWAKNFGGNGDDLSYGIASDGGNGIFATGYFRSSSIAFGSQVLFISGNSTIFLAKLDTAGNSLWARSAGGSGNEIAKAVASGSNGMVCFTGEMTSKPAVFGNTSISSAGGFDFFVSAVYPFSSALASSSNVSCFGLNNGSASVTISGGVSPYTYSWTSGQTTPTVSNLSAGKDTVTITDVSNCMIKTGLVITQPPALTLVSSSQPLNCTGGSAMATATGGTTPYQYSWSAGQTGSSIPQLPAGGYTVTVTDGNGCNTTSQDSVSRQATPIVPVCMVTTDSLSKYNIILWDKTAYTSIDSFIVYREISTNNYARLASVPYHALSEFTDTLRSKYFPNTGNPNAGTYRYKIQTRDTCGNYGSLSPYHNTIYIINNGGGTFSWPQLYTIENGSNPVTSYVLMRDDSSKGNWHPVSSVSGTQQTISDPQYQSYQSIASWRVETRWGISCVPSRINEQNSSSAGINSSHSNIYSNLHTGILNESRDLHLAVYPNPGNGYFTLETSGFQNPVVEIYSVIGELVYKESCKKEKSEINLTELPKGIYLLRLISAEGTAVKRIILQ